MNLFNKYLLLVTFETDDNYSIRFEMKKHYSHSTTRVVTCWLCSQLLGYGDTLLSLDKLLEHPDTVSSSEYIPHNDERMWFRRVERPEAVALLEGQDEGTFLIRPKDHGVHCLSIV